MGEARRALVRGLSTARQELNLIPRNAPSRLTNRLVRTRMLGGVRGRGLAAPSYSMFPVAPVNVYSAIFSKFPFLSILKVVAGRSSSSNRTSFLARFMIFMIVS